MELRLDLHIHSERSFDGCMSLSEIVALARERGLNGVAICDHDRVLDEVPEFDDFLVIPATEVSTERGHLLGLFVREPIETRKFSESVTAIHAQGGLAVIAHPFEHSTDANRLDDVMSRLTASKFGTVVPTARTKAPTPWRASWRKNGKSLSLRAATRICQKRSAAA